MQNFPDYISKFANQNIVHEIFNTEIVLVNSSIYFVDYVKRYKRKINFDIQRDHL